MPDGTPIAKLSGHPRDIIASLRSFRSPIDFQLGQAAAAGIRLIDGKSNPANGPGWKGEFRAGFAVILQAADGDRGAAVAESQGAGAHSALGVRAVVQDDLMDSNGTVPVELYAPPGRLAIAYPRVGAGPRAAVADGELRWSLGPPSWRLPRP